MTNKKDLIQGIIAMLVFCAMGVDWVGLFETLLFK